jgi:hypothetical protein
MIARHETPLDKAGIWAALAAPVPRDAISWRQDGKAVQRDGKWFARFVCYLDAHTVRERLDSVVSGEWDLVLTLLPALAGDGGVVEHDDRCAFKARLQILGVIRECVGSGRDYKAAATDAFKRAAVRFGIGAELYGMEQNWVQVDGDGKFAKPVEDPQAAYDRRAARTLNARTAPAATPREERETTAASETGDDDPGSAAPSTRTDAEPQCPKCGGRMWDNRLSKRNPKAPDFKCRDRNCDGVVWPPRENKARDAKGNGKQAVSAGGPLPGEDDEEPPFDDSEIPF